MAYKCLLHTTVYAIQAIPHCSWTLPTHSDPSIFVVVVVRIILQQQIL